MYDKDLKSYEKDGTFHQFFLRKLLNSKGVKRSVVTVECVDQRYPL